MSQTLAQAVGVRKAKELSYTARTFRGDEAVRIGVANEAVADKEALDALVEKRSAQIVANSPAAVAAMKDLYGQAQEGRGILEGLEQELSSEYPDITDTEERLSSF